MVVLRSRSRAGRLADADNAGRVDPLCSQDFLVFVRYGYCDIFVKLVDDFLLCAIVSKNWERFLGVISASWAGHVAFKLTAILIRLGNPDDFINLLFLQRNSQHEEVLFFIERIS